MVTHHRTAGEGSIFRRKDGRWCGQISYPSGARGTVYGKTQAEVRRLVQQAVQARNDDGQATAPAKITLARFLNDWMATVKPSIRWQTWQQYERNARLHVVPLLGAVQLVRIDRHHLNRLYAKKLGELSPTTVRHIHTLIRRALSDAERWGMVPRNVARLVDPPSKVRHRITTLSPTEAKRFLDEAAQDRLGALFILALMTGLRRGECLALRWRDVDLDAGEVAVRATVYRAGGALVFANPKTTRSNRIVSVPPYVVDALRRHQFGQDGERALRGSEWHDSGLVFTNGIGRAIEGSNLLRRSFYPILDRAGCLASGSMTSATPPPHY